MTNTHNTNLNEMTPAQIDEMLIELMRKQYENSRHLDSAIYGATNLDRETSASVVVKLSHRIGFTPRTSFFVSRTDFDNAPETTTTFTNGLVSIRKIGTDHSVLPDALAFLAKKHLSQSEVIKMIVANDKSDHAEKVKEVLADAVEIKNLMNAIDAEFTARGGWSRYFLVTSSTGHIHSSQSCHTCNKGQYSTTFALAYAMSDMSVEIAVQLLGPSLCSKCFPNAPVEMTEQAKIGASLASIYFDEGHDAFVRAQKIAQEKALKRASKKAVNA